MYEELLDFNGIYGLFLPVLTGLGQINCSLSPTHTLFSDSHTAYEKSLGQLGHVGQLGHLGQMGQWDSNRGKTGPPAEIDFFGVLSV